MMKLPKQWITLLAIGTMSAVLFTGCGTQANAVNHTAQAMQKEMPIVKQEKTEKQVTYITIEKAKEIALDHAGVNAQNARFENAEFDKDDGIPLYELEFTANNVEYEYDIHAESGTVLKAEKEKEKEKDDDRYDKYDKKRN